MTFKPVFDEHTQSIGAVADRSQEPEDRLGGHRRVVDAQQHLGRRRPLQDDRRRRHLAARRPRELRAHRPHPGEPGRRQHRLRLRHRPPLGQPRGARRLQDGRRRQDLEEGPLRGRRHRLLRPGGRSPGPVDPLRRHVAVPPHAALVLLRRQGQRPLQVDRRRRHLAAAQDRPARGREGADRRDRGAVAAERRLRPGRVGRHGPVPLRRHGRELAAGQQLVQRAGAPVLLRAPGGRPRGPQHASTSRA